MSRDYLINGLILVCATLILSACQLDPNSPVAYFLPRTPTPTPTNTPTPTSIPTPTPTNTPSPTPSPTPTKTPMPTASLVPSDRLEVARQAYRNGDYEQARQEFAALLTDPKANTDEQRLALHWRGRSELQAGEIAAAIATLNQFLDHYPADALSRAAQFNLGLAYEQNGQFEAAVTAYLGAIIPNDPINVYIYHRVGDVALQADQIQAAIEAYQAGIEATEDLTFQLRLREGIAAAHLQQENPAAALEQYDAILAVTKDTGYRAKILRLAGEAHLVASETEAAHERYLETVNQYPAAYDSYLALIELINAAVPVDDFQRGLVDYYAEAYQPAIAAFESYLNSAEVVPTSTPAFDTLQSTDPTTQTTSTATPATLPFAADALWLMGLSWQALGQYNQTIANFEQLIDKYPANTNWGKAHLEIGKSQSWQNNLSQAKTTFRDFAAKNPGHPLAPEALWWAGQLEMDEDLFTEAARSLRELAEKYPNSDYATDSLYWAGQAAFLAEDYEQAADTWGKLFKTYPTNELASFGGYWQARALRELDQETAAEQVLTEISDRSEEYYGLRARDLLVGVSPHTVPLSTPAPAQLAAEQAEAEAWLTRWTGISATVRSTLRSDIQADPAFQRGQALLNLGLRAEALAEFETVKEKWWNDALAMYQLAVYFSEQGLNQLSIVVTARLIFLSPAEQSEEAPLFLQRLYYPFSFAEVIFAEAEAQEIDPALLLAIMRQESLFEPSAESIVGARGLMQVMPPTGEYVAERSDFGPFHVDQLWLPYISIKFGAWYIEQQLDIFDGNQFAALAAYNAGPGNVLEWVKTSDDLDIFVESIPYRESRLYIRNIYVNLAAYRRIYGPPTPAQGDN